MIRRATTQIKKKKEKIKPNNHNQNYITSRRFALSQKPFFPIEARNLRRPGGHKKKRRRGRGLKGSARGIKAKNARGNRPNHRVWEGGRKPLFMRIPKWPQAWLARKLKVLEPLNLSKLRTFLEQGRLDHRYAITQRHLHDSKCVKVKNGVKLFNVNDYPFPYKIHIDVMGADQSSIDAIRRVGGCVSITYRERVNMRAHIKPHKFEVLPKTARPNLEGVHYLEKMRARGCDISYVMPTWLLQEREVMQRDRAEFEAESYVVHK